MRTALLLVAALNGLAFAAQAFSQTAPADSSALANLSAQARDDIARVCLPVQYRDGAPAYRECVRAEVAKRADTRADVGRTELSFDDRYAVQQACLAATTALDNKRCVQDQLNALAALPKPNLASLNNDENYVMQQACFVAQTQRGAAAYRQCQLSEIRSIQNQPSPNLAELSIVDRNALQLNCSAKPTSLAAYRACLVEGSAPINAVAAEPTQAVAQAVAGTQAAATPATPNLPRQAAIQVSTGTSTASPTASPSAGPSASTTCGCRIDGCHCAGVNADRTCGQ